SNSHNSARPESASQHTQKKRGGSAVRNRTFDDLTLAAAQVQPVIQGKADHPNHRPHSAINPIPQRIKNTTAHKPPSTAGILPPSHPTILHCSKFAELGAVSEGSL